MSRTPSATGSIPSSCMAKHTYALSIDVRKPSNRLKSRFNETHRPRWQTASLTDANPSHQCDPPNRSAELAHQPLQLNTFDVRHVRLRLRPIQRYHAVAHSAESSAACSITVC